MKLEKFEHKPQREFLRVELFFLVEAEHPLVKFRDQVIWAVFEEQLEPSCRDKTEALGIDSRPMVVLDYLNKEHFKMVHADTGYRGHDYAGIAEVLTDQGGRGSIPKRVWRWMKCYATLELTIGHLKSDYRLERNRLKGRLGDAFNAFSLTVAV